jgi:uncharacterized sulfatase
VLIYVDDQAAWTLGFRGNPQAHTPHLDRLAERGAHFTNSFCTTPVCSPARGAMLASRYSTELGILDFITPTTHKAYTAETGDLGLESKFVTYPELLAGEGYATGLFGKWHLGDWRSVSGDKYHPGRHGFSHFFGFIGGSAGPTNPEIEVEGVARTFTGPTDDILTDAAIAYIEQSRQKPFFVQLALRSPHSPWLPAANEDVAPFARLDPALPEPDFPDLDVDRAKKMMREYLICVSSVDRHVGRVIAALERAKLTDDTIVIFSSDHGYNLGHHGIWHKGNGYWLTNTLPPDRPNIPGKFRPNLYDHSLRTPLVISWPGVVKPSLALSETVTGLDFFPSILAMAGVALPASTGIRGRNFLPLLRGEKIPEWNNDLYSEYSMRVYARTDMRSYRTPRWKLVRDFLNPGRDELYHLERDPGEKRNLIGDSTLEVAAARQMLEARIHENMVRNHDPLLVASSGSHRG